MELGPRAAPELAPRRGYDPGVDVTSSGYALLDAGDGRRLERFGSVIVDRPAPAAGWPPRGDADLWATATWRFERDAGAPGGAWLPAGALAAPWTIALDDLALELRPTPAGQVGLFPEHIPVATWAAARARSMASLLGRPPDVLNLFGYTGLATLALARDGARVAHVDASRPAVAWARRNAQLSGLMERPVRWLVDDAPRFVAREARRGRRYDGVLLDPPTYGHGPSGVSWHLGDDLAPLLASVGSLLSEGPWFLACTAHATGLAPSALDAAVRAGLGRAVGPTEMLDLALVSKEGARLPAGAAILAQGPDPGGRG
jgi:23S rRNA (cytosine1962-C5)-methyltransferase